MELFVTQKYITDTTGIKYLLFIQITTTYYFKIDRQYFNKPNFNKFKSYEEKLTEGVYTGTYFL